MRAEGAELMGHTTEVPFLIPDFTARDITDIDFHLLNNLGVKHVLVDLDLTIRKAGTNEVIPEAVALFEDIRRDGIVQTVSVVTSGYGELAAIVEPLGAQLYITREKSSAYFKQIIQVLEAESGEVVMIGNSPRHDIAGANKAGLVTVLVEPLSRDWWINRIRFVGTRDKVALAMARRVISKSQKMDQ